MYKPIIENNKNKISSLYNLLKKLYLIIGIIIFLIGLIITPFLKFLIKDNTISDNIYLLYIIQLFSVFITYTYSAKISLINAYKNNYITTIFNSLSSIIKNLLQIIVVCIWKSIYLYFFVSIISEIILLIITSIYSKYKYKIIIKSNNIVDDNTKKEVSKNVKAAFFHKIGGLLVNTVDSVVISVFIGITILGKYSNYITIITALTTILSLIFTQVTSIIGHSFYENNKVQFKKYFYLFYLLNYFVSSFGFICYYACVDTFISLFFDSNLILAKEIVFIITINYFIQFMEHSVRLFKDSTGLFYYDRYKCIFEGIINLVLSIIFVKFFGIQGVLISTIITNLSICHVVEPYVLFKHAFNESTKFYYILNYTLITIFILIVILYSNIINIVHTSLIINFILNGLVASLFALPSLIILLIYIKKYFFNQNKS